MLLIFKRYCHSQIWIWQYLLKLNHLEKQESSSFSCIGKPKIAALLKEKCQRKGLKRKPGPFSFVPLYDGICF